MTNEFRHVLGGTALTKAEYESITGHELVGGADGDIIIRSGGKLIRLAKGADNSTLTLISGLPGWSTSPTAHTLASHTAKAHSDLTGIVAGDHHAKYTDAEALAAVPAASVTVAGKVELATAAEATTGSDATRAVTPDGLAGSDVMGGRAIQAVVFDFTVDIATGDGKFYFHVDQRLAGMNIVDVHAEVITAGTTGTTDIQLRNVTQAADILSTELTIDSGETGSDTAAAAAVISGTEDDLTLHDVIAVDVDAVSTTAPRGLIVTIGCRLP